MSSSRRWLEIATPPPMYCRPSVACGLPSPTSDPAKALCSWQMEHCPVLSCLTFAGWTIASSTRKGAPRGRSHAPAFPPMSWGTRAQMQPRGDERMWPTCCGE
eukprot:2461072-Pyramimonas_sp.AAC.1